MKTNFKRLFALLLTLCMLATLMVPVAFAEDAAVEAPSANVAETYPIRLKDMNHTEPSTATGTDKLLTTTSSSAATGYKYYRLPLADAKVANAYADGTLNFKGIAAAEEFTYREDQMWQARISSGWGAMQIRVSESGLYALNVTTDKTPDDETEINDWTNLGTQWSGDVTAYIIPLAAYNNALASAVATEEATAEQIAIAGLMTDDYSVGTASMAADQTELTFAKTRMEMGEYVVVINASGYSFSFCEMSLIGDTFETSEVVNYGIQLVDPTTMTAEEVYNSNIPEKSLFVTATTDEATGTTTYAYTTNNVAISKIVDSYYNNDTIKWDWLEGSYYYRSANNFQLRLDKDKAIAFRIKVPTAGKYALTLSTADAAAYTMNAYVLNMNDVPAGNTSYLALATADNSVGDAVVTADKAGTFDSKYYEAGEYVVIISNTSGNHFPIRALGLIQYTVDAFPESEKVTGTVATYDFEIYDEERYAPMFTSTSTDENGETVTTMSNKNFGNKIDAGLEGVYVAGETIQAALERDYNAGIINWKYVGAGNGGTAYVYGESKNGIRIQKSTKTESAVSVWVAFEVNVPTGGYYSASLNSESTGNSPFSVYVLDADDDIASSLTEENKVASFAEKAAYLGFAAEFTAGKNIVVFQLPETTEKVTIYLSGITLSVLEGAMEYNFALDTNEAFLKALSVKTLGQITTPAGWTNLKNYTYTDAEGVTQTFQAANLIAQEFAAGNMNWAPDASGASVADGGDDTKNFRVDTESLRLVCNAGGTVDSYFGLRIRVPAAGTYTLSTTVTDAVNLYMFEADNAMAVYGDRLRANREDGVKLVDLIAAAEPFATTVKNVALEVQYTFDKPGEYVFTLVKPASTAKSFNITSMTLTPVENNAIADGVGYATFEEAVANATESVVMLKNEQVDNLVVPVGVTLNLNGYTMHASSVDASASGAQIIDATDGKGLIRGDIEFGENNAQLPLYDVDANGYRLFNVDVVSSATTGKASNTKYWFKVNFANSAAFELIGLNTELRINALMTGTYKTDDNNGHIAGDPFAAVASADAAFTNTWAVNSGSYIVVSAVGGNLEDFSLSPAVSANGVVISGDAMHKGA